MLVNLVILFSVCIIFFVVWVIINIMRISKIVRFRVSFIIIIIIFCVFMIIYKNFVINFLIFFMMIEVVFWIGIIVYVII